MRTKLSNEQLGEISRRVRGIEDRIENQSLDYQRAIQGLQQVFEGTIVVNGVARNFSTEPEETSKTRIIEVYYSLSLVEMVEIGKYDKVDKNLREQTFRIEIPPESRGMMRFETKLFCFGGPVSSEYARRQIHNKDRRNLWLAARIEHLLSYGATFKEEQRVGPIVSLGFSATSNVDDHLPVPFLSGNNMTRDVDLGWEDDSWSHRYRFLAVRKVSAPRT